MSRHLLLTLVGNSDNCHEKVKYQVAYIYSVVRCVAIHIQKSFIWVNDVFNLSMFGKRSNREGFMKCAYSSIKRRIWEFRQKHNLRYWCIKQWIIKDDISDERQLLNNYNVGTV